MSASSWWSRKGTSKTSKDQIVFADKEIVQVDLAGLESALVRLVLPIFCAWSQPENCLHGFD